MNQANTSSLNRSVVAFFESRDAAQRAVDKLAQAGVARSDINMVEGGSRGAGSTSSTSSTSSSASMSSTSSTSSRDVDKGFWESLKDLFLPDEDRQTYA